AAPPCVGPAGKSDVGLDDRCAVGGSLHGLAALQRRGLGLVGLPRRDDLTVAGLQPEPVLARPVLIHLKLACHDSHLHDAIKPSSDRPAAWTLVNNRSPRTRPAASALLALGWPGRRVPCARTTRHLIHAVDLVRVE